MTRDYAKRSQPGRAGTTRRARSSQRTGRREPRTTWSAPSFSAGAIFGAALVLLASYAPRVFEDTVVSVREQVAPPVEEIEFEFPEILENDTVEVDTSAYPAEFPGEDPNAPPVEYLIQAISLKSYDAAHTLSKDLNAAGLAARFERVDLTTGTWYRVMVGPFPSRLEANRAMTELRRRNMGPRLIKLG